MAWHTEQALSIGYGIRVYNALPKIVQFAEDLVQADAVSWDSDVSVGSCDRRAYCRKGKEDYEIWYITQSRAFVALVQSAKRLGGIKLHYSVRIIKRSEYKKGNLKADAFSIGRRESPQHTVSVGVG